MKKILMALVMFASFDSYAQHSRQDVLNNLANSIRKEQAIIMYRSDFPTHCLTRLMVDLNVQSNGLIRARMITRTSDDYGDRQILERIETATKPHLNEISEVFGDEINILIPILASHESDGEGLPVCETTEEI